MPFDEEKLRQATAKFDPAKLEQALKARQSPSAPEAPAAPAQAPSASPSPSPSPSPRPLYDESGRAIVTETPQTGMPSAGDFDFKTSAKQTGSYLYDNFVQGQIIPVMASIAATRLPAVAAGSAIKNIVSPLVEGAYQGTAGYLADKANQALDISPPGEDQAIAQGGLQGLTAMAQKGFRIMSPWAGRGGAVKANELAHQEAAKMVQGYMPATDSKTAFLDAAQNKASVHLRDTRLFVQDTIKEMYKHDPSANPGNLEAKLKKHYGSAGEHIYSLYQATKQNKGIPSDTWQWLHTRLGEDLGAMQKPGISPKGTGEASQLYGKMLDDLERVAEREAKPGAQTNMGATKLLDALKTYRREQSVSKLQGAVEKAMGISRGQGGDASFNAAAVIRDLKKDRFFSKSFTPDEQQDITKTLHILNKAPHLPPAHSEITGSRHMVERGVGAAGGASVGGAAGAVAGFAFRDAVSMAENLSFALSLPSGRALVRELAQSKGGLYNKRGAAVLASYATALKNQPMDEE